MVDNALKGVMLGVGLILTVVLISMAIYAATRGRDASVRVADTLSEAENALVATQYSVYEGTEIQGYNVIDAIGKYSDDLTIEVYRTNKESSAHLVHLKTDVNNVQQIIPADEDPDGSHEYHAIVFMGSTIVGGYGSFDCVTDAMTFNNSPSNASTYINPMSEYTGKIIRNANGVPTTIQFTETTYVTDLASSLASGTNPGGTPGGTPGYGGGGIDSNVATELALMAQEIEDLKAAVNGNTDAIIAMSGDITAAIAQASDDIQKSYAEVGSAATGSGGITDIQYKAITDALGDVSDGLATLTNLITTMPSDDNSAEALERIERSLATINTRMDTLDEAHNEIISNTDGVDTKDLASEYNSLVGYYNDLRVEVSTLSSILDSVNGSSEFSSTVKSSLNEIYTQFESQLALTREMLASMRETLSNNGVTEDLLIPNM